MFRASLVKMAENAAKRIKTDGVAIGTHNGHFHADEALAVYMLRKHVPTYSNAKLVRTRDPKLLEECHTVVDVGGVYDAAANRYDHHQRTFATTFPGRATKLSSDLYDITVFGAEPHTNYNRILLSPVLRGGLGASVTALARAWPTLEQPSGGTGLWWDKV